MAFLAPLALVPEFLLGGEALGGLGLLGGAEGGLMSGMMSGLMNPLNLMGGLLGGGQAPREESSFTTTDLVVVGGVGLGAIVLIMAVSKS